MHLTTLPCDPPVDPAPPALLLGVRSQDRLDEVDALGLTGHAGDPDLDAVVESVALALDVPLAVVNLVRPDLQTYPAAVGVQVACTRVPDRLSFCAEVVDTGQALQVHDAREHPLYRDNPLVRDGAVVAYAGVPLVHRGVAVGTLSVFDPAPRTFTARELQLLQAQARLAATVLSLRWAAGHDVLTGLANRRGAATAAAAAATPVSVLFLDVDDFKAVNDAHGHAQGDAVLQGLADVLRASVAGSARLPVRWGGDEFLVLMPGTGPDEARAVAEQLVATVGQGPASACSVTVGVATGGAGTSWDELLRRAAGAAAAGKRTGKGGTTSALPVQS